MTFQGGSVASCSNSSSDPIYKSWGANLITTFITCRNHGKYLQKAISSILAQTIQPKELILINDGSSDESLEIMKKYQNYSPTEVRVFNHPDPKGHIYSYNEAISMATGEYIHLMAADDFFFCPEGSVNNDGRKFYARALNMFQDSKLGYVSCGLRHVGFDGMDLGQVILPIVQGIVSPLDLLGLMGQYGNFTNGGGTLVRALAQERYEPELPYTADFLQWINILRKGWKGGYIREPLYAYRRHLYQMTDRPTPPEERKIIEEKLQSAISQLRKREVWV